MDWGESIGIWVAAGLTLMIFSFLYKDNPVFKLGEHIFLGFAIGYSWCIYYWNNILPKAIQPLIYPSADIPRDFLVLIPIILGLFIIVRIVPSLSWLSRISFAILVGGFAGIAVPSVIAGTFLPQLVATIGPIGPGVVAGINQLVLLVGVFATLIFFFFSLEHRGAVGKISRVGLLYLMIMFGASFGYTVMARVSLLIGRVQFLLQDWFTQCILGRSI